MELITLPLLLRWVGALLLTLCFMLLAVYLLQGGRDKLKQQQATRRLKKLESLPLTRTTTAHLLEAENQTLLLITDATGSTLHPLENSKNKQPENAITRTPK